MEICSECHPFFTGEMKFVDRQGRVDKFKKKRKLAQQRKKKQEEEKKKKKQAKQQQQDDSQSYQDILRQAKADIRDQDKSSKQSEQEE